MKKILFCLLGIVLFSSCTEQSRAKNFGGTMKVELPKGKKLMMATWKGTDLYYLYKSMEEGDKPDTIVFKEKSVYGVLETKIIFIENK